MTRLILINPNSNWTTTHAMVAIARTAVPASIDIVALTAPFGPGLIVDEAGLAIARQAVLALAPQLGVCDGVIVSAFGDPGLSDLRLALDCPVTGIAEAGMAEASEGGRPFAVVTTTRELRTVIAATAAQYGHGDLYRGSVITPGDPQALMADPQRLADALVEACAAAIRDFGAEALVIGGGPLAIAARALSEAVTVPLIEPVSAAARRALRRADQAGLLGPGSLPKAPR